MKYCIYIVWLIYFNSNEVWTFFNTFYWCIHEIENTKMYILYKSLNNAFNIITKSLLQGPGNSVKLLEKFWKSPRIWFHPSDMNPVLESTLISILPGLHFLEKPTWKRKCPFVIYSKLLLLCQWAVIHHQSLGCPTFLEQFLKTCLLCIHIVYPEF